MGCNPTFSFPASVYGRSGIRHSLAQHRDRHRPAAGQPVRYSHYHFGDYDDDAYLRIGSYPRRQGVRAHKVGLDPIAGDEPIVQHNEYLRAQRNNGTERERAMRLTITSMAGLVAVAGALAVAGCGKRPEKAAGPAERTGAALDKAAEKTADAAKTTAEAAKDAAGVAVQKTGEALEKAGAATEKAGADMQK